MLNIVNYFLTEVLFYKPVVVNHGLERLTKPLLTMDVNAFCQLLSTSDTVANHGWLTNLKIGTILTNLWLTMVLESFGNFFY